ncbi:unnamed protein product [Angiostrongylus costaricensis]|uniref:GPI alpha-1,4-mannosyltransferase I, catalytic subunit n=1 Tax=Angiostrongylus costaricensis TaxID=334426 RepID=A0A0R3PV35_ANGCS|nr:unnamed protein product [Angiostrongylus costaricensis]
MVLVEGNTPQRWTRGKLLFVSLAVRFTLILYSNIHDYMFHVNFTDIDYSVYSDAARYVAAGESPFNRVTYRLSYDLSTYARPSSLRSRGHKEGQPDDDLTLAVVVFWLANPLIAVISARGNADVLVCAAVLFTLYLLKKEHVSSKFYL